MKNLKPLEILKIHNQVLQDVVIESTIETNDIYIAKSFLNNDWYDTLSFDSNKIDFNVLKTEINKLKNKGIDFSIYLPHKFVEKNTKLITSLQIKLNGEDVYMFKKIETSDLFSKEVNGVEIAQLTQEYYSQFINLVNEIHGNEMGWSKAQAMSELLVKSSSVDSTNKFVKIYVAKVNNRVVAYASAIASLDMNLIYFTFDGVKNEFRRQKIYSALNYERVKFALQKGINQSYVITGREGKAYQGLLKQGYENIAEFDYFTLE